MKKIFILLILVFVITGCQKTIAPAQQMKEVFDVKTGEHMQQISSQKLTNGWLFKLTNGGIPDTDPNEKESIVVVKLQGKSEPTRLKEL